MTNSGILAIRCDKGVKVLSCSACGKARQLGHDLNNGGPNVGQNTPVILVRCKVLTTFLSVFNKLTQNTPPSEPLGVVGY